MVTTTFFIPRVHAALGKQLRHAAKRVYQAARWRSGEPPRVLFIVGCQRSGTTMMTRLFDVDRNCRVFGEFSALSSADKATRIRLNPLPDVAATINRVRARLVVAKPLVETQNLLALLDYFPGSMALFMYRSYADVARSDLRKFGPRNALENIRPIAEGDAHNWRSSGASPAVRELVRRFYSPRMSVNDAAALFWFARNRLFFDLDLARRPDVMLCRYEHLTHEPLISMRRIYAFANAPCPDLSHTAQVRSAAVTRDAFELSPAVRALCEQLQADLDAEHERAIGVNRSD